MAEPQPSPDPLVGEVIAARYRIESRVGEGAMGAVYKARHVKVGRPFAVKVLHRRLLADRKVAERFEREAELAGRLHHPNVIGVVDIGETQGTRYMVMDFAEGADLATLLNEAPFAPARVSAIAKQLCDGLFHAHEQGLIHRDFKPENVIIERDVNGVEVPRIVDFGIAILREAGDSPEAPGRLTTNGLVLGTPHYMAPEQAVADPIDHRIDLFALGIMIYEMLCGKLPFDGTGAEVARANLMLDPPMISQRVPFLDVDPLLEALSRRLMAKQRDARPPTGRAARELLDLIDRDREAAAVALGVPVATALGSRTPVTTESMSPRKVQPSEPPPLAVGAEPAFDARAREGRDTDMVWSEPRRNRGVLLAAVAAVVGLGIGLVVELERGGDDNAPPVAAVHAAAVPAPPPPTPAPAPTPAPDPLPTATPAPVVPAVASTPPPTTPTPAPPTQARPHVAAAQPKLVPPTSPSAAITSGQLGDLYKQVGQEITQLKANQGEMVADDLMAEFGLIRIVQEMSASPARRAEVAANLTKLHREVIARTKRSPR